MQVTPGQPFSIGGIRLVLEVSEDGSFEVRLPDETAPARTTFQDLGAEIDKKIGQAMGALNDIKRTASTVSPPPPVPGI